MSRSAPAILLDLDGTLVDSQSGIQSSCLNALRSLGHEPEPSLDLSGMIGPPIEDIMRRLLQPYGDDRITEAVAAYRADYGRSGLFGSHPYAGIPEALATMRASGARLYVATSKRTAFATRILEHVGLADCFEDIHGSEDHGALDHKPELLSYVLKRHGIAQRICVMVGDRRHDVSGAHANDMPALGVLWGYGTREELEAVGADALVAEPPGLASAALAIVLSRT